ncbi:fimbria/pilus outer membrane usher protein [unidentified bacterial endosymbiont]|uniref:fimbria/pilus outer membrane usher protein n=1 Tax=unidentified bacterial endosymbiont TaxID=2355 RepID=UPI002646AA4A|nr:fimbria/pilus outer membrane usher protein [unidentified bacterial endosymbiont]
MDARFYFFSSAAGLVLCSGNVHCAEFSFDSFAIENTNQTMAKNINLNQFNGYSHPEGEYYVAVRINNKLVARTKLNFVHNKEGKLAPVLSIATLHTFGLFFADDAIDANEKLAFPGALEGVSVTFNFIKQILDINIPQALLKNGPDADLSVVSSQWDEGVNALSLNYDINGAQKQEQGESFKPEEQYMRLMSGANVGAWRFRSIGTLDKPEDDNTTWSSDQVWVQRDIPLLRSMLIAGDSSSDGALFDSVSYRGVSLATDNAMYSDQAQGYAPVIRGIARTSNAQVEISQNGNVISKRYVSAGPFVINDLYPQSGGGELNVRITEADGSTHYFTQPWGMVSAMQRPGHLRYSVNAGRTDNNDADNQIFSQMTFFYGLPGEMTVFGGGLVAQKYKAADVGYALGLQQFGSISADVTAMRFNSDTLYAEGQNYRLQYSKNLIDSNTDISLSWSFAPSENYIAFPDAITHYDDDDELTAYQKNKLQVSVNQPIGDANTFALSAWRAEYWHRDTQESLSLSDNFSLGQVSVSMGWAWTQNEENETEQQFSLNVQIPFALFAKDTWVSLASNLQRPGAPSQSLGINGNAFDDDSLNWNMNATHGDSATTEQSANVNYKGRHGEYSANYSHATARQSLSYEVKGSLIASACGIAAGQPFDTNDAVALVKARNAPGLVIKNNPGVVTDRFGHAIVPYLQPYRQDTVALDTEKMRSDIEPGNTVVSTVPTEGAIVVAEFSPHVGAKLLVTLRAPDGALLPFGATATAGKASNEGIIDENGQVYLSGVSPEGTIVAQWGDPARVCHAPYKIKTESGKRLYELQLHCQ